jgi:hypothetical protein
MYTKQQRSDAAAMQCLLLHMLALEQRVSVVGCSLLRGCIFL